MRKAINEEFIPSLKKIDCVVNGEEAAMWRSEAETGYQAAEIAFVLGPDVTLSRCAQPKTTWATKNIILYQKLYQASSVQTYLPSSPNSSSALL